MHTPPSPHFTPAPLAGRYNARRDQLPARRMADDGETVANHLPGLRKARSGSPPGWPSAGAAASGARLHAHWHAHSTHARA